MSRRAQKWAIGLGVPAILILALALAWSWDWFIPMVESRASAAVGRKVTIGHLHVALGSPIEITADNIVVSNPPEWNGPPFATAERLKLTVHVWNYIRHGQLVIPLIQVEKAGEASRLLRVTASFRRSSSG